MKQRIDIVDALRGIASLAVCWFHMTLWHPDDSVIRISGSYGRFGIEIFFVISGFIIPFTLYREAYRITQNWGTFILKRIIRIEPPYLVAAAMPPLLAYLSALGPGFKGTGPDFSTAQILLHLGYLNAIFDYPWLNPAFWTLAIEFQFYFLISLFFPILVSANAKIRALGIICFCLAAFIIPSDVFVFKYLCLFAIGIVTFQYFARIITIREYALLLAVTSFFLFQSLGEAKAVVGVVTALVIGFVRIKKTKIIAFFGVISYSLYLVHIPIGWRLVHFGKRFATTGVEYFVVSLCGFLLSICSAYFFFRFIEKPAREWSSRIKYCRYNISSRDISEVNIETENVKQPRQPGVKN